jgi:hypothetical protein
MPTGIYGNTFALADFLGTGRDALVVHTLLYDPTKPSTFGDYGKIYFFEKNASGSWIDRTAAILANNVGCLHPRKAVVADFNNDGRPDVFFACHGADAPPFSGEAPHVLLSQPDGTYSNVTLPVTCYCHGASAADVNGDGYPDVLLVDPSVAGQPYFLLNNGDGTFASDKSRLPPLVVGKQIYTAELIDFSGSGQYDVFLAGNEPGTTAYHSSEQGPVVLPNDGTGHFISTAPLDLMVGLGYGLALDIVFTGPNIYLLKVNPGYTANQIQRIAYPGLTGNTIFTSSRAYPNGWTWVDWIIPYQGTIMSENAAFGLVVPQ